MSDLIDRQAVIDALWSLDVELRPSAIDAILSMLKGLPSAQPEVLACGNGELSAQPERKTGKWIYGEDDYGIDGYHCDKCGFFVPWDYTHRFINYIDDYHYCPNCGADMRGEEK